MGRDIDVRARQEEMVEFSTYRINHLFKVVFKPRFVHFLLKELIPGE